MLQTFFERCLTQLSYCVATKGKQYKSNFGKMPTLFYQELSSEEQAQFTPNAAIILDIVRSSHGRAFTDEEQELLSKFMLAMLTLTTETLNELLKLSSIYGKKPPLFQKCLDHLPLVEKNILAALLHYGLGKVAPDELCESFVEGFLRVFDRRFKEVDRFIDGKNAEKVAMLNELMEKDARFCQAFSHLLSPQEQYDLLVYFIDDITTVPYSLHPIIDQCIKGATSNMPDVATVADTAEVNVRFAAMSV